jgi:hypothetical protein
MYSEGFFYRETRVKGEFPRIAESGNPAAEKNLYPKTGPILGWFRAVYMRGV